MSIDSMAKPPRRGRPPLGLAVQAAHLRRLYPDGRLVLRPHLLTWLGHLTPTEVSASYEVLLGLQPDRDPIIYVVQPALHTYQGNPLPHVFGLNTLCLYLGEQEWGPWDLVAATLLPWALEWLFFYEVWLTTGEWMGGGEHPGKGPVGSRSGRGNGRTGRHKRLDRLTAALRQAYGSDVDMKSLLANTKV